MNGTATTLRPELSSWTDEATTTTAPRPARQGRGNRTVDPVGKEKAQLLAVCLAHDRRIIAWLSFPERITGVQITAGYFLEIEVNEGDVGFAGDAVDVVSSHASVSTKRINVMVAPHHGLATARTTLGKRLWQLRARIVARGERLLGWDDIDRALEARRGERNR